MFFQGNTPMYSQDKPQNGHMLKVQVNETWGPPI